MFKSNFEYDEVTVKWNRVYFHKKIKSFIESMLMICREKAIDETNFSCTILSLIPYGKSAI